MLIPYTLGWSYDVCECECVFCILWRKCLRTGDKLDALHVKIQSIHIQRVYALWEQTKKQAQQSLLSLYTCFIPPFPLKHIAHKEWNGCALKKINSTSYTIQHSNWYVKMIHELAKYTQVDIAFSNIQMWNGSSLPWTHATRYDDHVRLLTYQPHTRTLSSFERYYKLFTWYSETYE